MPSNIVEKKFIVINHLDKPEDSRAMLWLKFSSEKALQDLFEKHNIPKNQDGLYKQEIILKNNENVDDFTISLESHPEDTSACVLRFPKEALKITERENAYPEVEILEPYKLALLNHMKKILPEESWAEKIEINIKCPHTGSPLEHTVLNFDREKDSAPQQQQQQPSKPKQKSLKHKIEHYLNQPFPKSRLLLKIACAAIFACPILAIMAITSPSFLSLPFVMGAIATTASATLGFWGANMLNRVLWGSVEFETKLNDNKHPHLSEIAFSGSNILPVKKSVSELKTKLEKLYETNDIDKTSKEISGLANEAVRKRAFLFYPRDVDAAKNALSEQNQTEDSQKNTPKQAL